MKTKVPYYYKDFKCISSKCTDTCCAGWEIIIDDETFNKYKKVNSNFGNKLHSKITYFEDGEPGFALEKNNNCPFLNDKKLCDIYSELGEDYLCYTCKQFPRFTNEYGNLREIGISMSCPEAARIMLMSSEKVTFDISENDEIVSTYNDINADLYLQIMPSRKIAIDIMQNRNLTIDERLCLLLKFAHDIQEEIDEDNLSNISNIRKNYSSKEFQEELLSSLKNYKSSSEDKQNLMLNYLNTFLQLDNLTEEWPVILKSSFNQEILSNYSNYYKEFNEYYKSKEYEYEHLIVYFIFRYFMESVYDWDVYSKIKLAIVSYIIIKEISIAKWIETKEFTTQNNTDIMQLYSKEIEHSDDNMEKLAEIFNTEEIFSLRYLISLIC